MTSVQKGATTVTKAGIEVGDDALPPVNRRAEILKHASRIFAERGYDATSIEDICQASGIGRGLIYHYFKSKDELLRVIHASIFRPLHAEFEGVYNQGGTPSEVLRGLARVFLRAMSEHRDEAIIWARETQTLQANEEYWGEIHLNRSWFFDTLENTINAGIAQGLFRELDVQLAAHAWANLIEHNYTWFRSGGRLTSDELADGLMDIYIQGLSAKADPAA